MSLDASANPVVTKLSIVNPDEDIGMDHIDDIVDIADIHTSSLPDRIIERPNSPVTIMLDETLDMVQDDLTVEEGIGEGEDTSLLKNTKNGIADSIKNCILEEFTTMWSNVESPLNKSVMMKILIRAMEIVEKTDIKGQEQQEVVINVLVEILESDVVVSVHKESLIAFLKEDASDVISIVVDASKGKININKLENIAVRLFKKIVVCFA
jgi:hypothetical protein